jgi:nitrite reductase/ring-hydroxylating ferredoxin subunit
MTILCHIDDIAEGKSKGFTLGERFLFAVKKFGQIYLYENSCPHLGIQLEWTDDEFLDADGSLILCSMHGALFKIDDGLCIAGPCQGQALTTIEFQIDNDQIVIQD